MHFNLFYTCTSLPGRECKAISDDGYTKTGLYRIHVWRIKPHNEEFTAYYDMSLSGGGWTIIQRRVNKSVSFDRTDLVIIWILSVSGLSHKKQLWIGLESFEKYDQVADHQWKSEQTWVHVRYKSLTLGCKLKISSYHLWI